MSKTLITPEQIQAAEGEVLSGLLGEVLQPGETNHHGFALDCSRLHKYRCYKCNKIYDNFNAIRESTCRIPDPIALSWDNAMKHFRTASDEELQGVRDAMVDIFLREIDDEGKIADAILHLSKREIEINAEAWFLHFGEEKHYLQAAAICKLNAEKGTK